VVDNQVNVADNMAIEADRQVIEVDNQATVVDRQTIEADRQANEVDIRILVTLVDKACLVTGADIRILRFRLGNWNRLPGWFLLVRHDRKPHCRTDC